MSKQKPMTKAEREEARQRRKQLKDASTEMRSGSFKLPSQTKLKKLRKLRKENPDRSSKPARPSKKKDPLLVHRHGEPLSQKLKKKQQRIKDKLKIRG